jgi:hypothetical protein
MKSTTLYGLVSDMNVNAINKLCGRCNYLSSSTVALDFSPLPNSWKEEIYMCIKNALTFELQFINDFPIKQKGQIYIRC